ncbi:hypothetical protein C8F01DRAFT_1092969 [Mycena amicta]|nr:hypothetical protein C8F01DRAFT_1092969 [Mycena amicta]
MSRIILIFKQNGSSLSFSDQILQFFRLVTVMEVMEKQKRSEEYVTGVTQCDIYDHGHAWRSSVGSKSIICIQTTYNPSKPFTTLQNCNSPSFESNGILRTVKVFTSYGAPLSHMCYNYRRKEFNEFQNHIDASVRDTVSSSSDSDSPEAGPVLPNDEMVDDEVTQPAAPILSTKFNPTPLPGDITATPPDQVPVPTLLGLPLRGLKKGVYRGEVWESTLVPAPQLPAELPSFLGGSNPYRRTRIEP